MVKTHAALAATLTAALALAACGGSDDAAPTTEAAEAVEAPVDAGETAGGDAAGVRVVSANDAAATIDAAPADLVVLDVRTPEEFAEGHIEGATMLDFYRDDFGEQLAQLDPDVPYVVYCRSGNRSGETRAMMVELGFTDVEDVEGGILAWAGAGLPIVTP